MSIVYGTKDSNKRVSERLSPFVNFFKFFEKNDVTKANKNNSLSISKQPATGHGPVVKFS